MPYYFIKLCVQANPSVLMDWRKGVRFDEHTDIDVVWNKYKLMADEQYGKALTSFEVVMIARQSEEYRIYILEKGRRRLSDEPPLGGRA